MFKKTHAFLSAITAAVLLCSCGAKGDSSSKTESSSAAEATTTKATVTLPQESSSADESAASNEQSSITPLMWKITTPEGNEMTLIGSMHALTDECYPLPDRIMTAYESADVVACEFDVIANGSDLASQLTIMNESMYEDKAENIALHLSKETCDGLTGFFEHYGYSMDIMKHYKPWMLDMQCEQLISAEGGLDTQKGIDMHIIQKAHDDGKEIFETESFELQMGIFTGLSDDVYDVLLSAYTVDNLETLKKNLTDTYEVWKKGDISATEAFFTQADEETYGALTDKQKAALDEYNQALLYDRNKGMAECADKLLKEHKNTFFMVGLAHFIGEGGIIDLLEQKGYKAELI